MRLTTLTLMLAATAFPVSLRAAPAIAPDPTFTGGDLFNLEAAADPQISPDGKVIAYVRRSADVMSDRVRSTLWLVDTRTGAQRPLAAGPGSHFNPRWSPNGDRLAFLSTAEGGGAQLTVTWLAGGESARVTGLPNTPTSLAWSPDGRQIAYAMAVPDEGAKLGAAPAKPEGAKWADPLQVITATTYRSDDEGYLKPGYSHLFVVPADGGAPRQISFGAVNDEGTPSWSPDGRSIVFAANRSPEWERDGRISDVHSVDVASGEVTTLTKHDGPTTSPVISPDGRWIAFTGFHDDRRGNQDSKLIVIDRQGGSRRILTPSLDRDVQGPIWSADSRAIFVGYDDHGVRKVARVGLDGSVREAARGLTGTGYDRPYTGGSFSVARDGSLAVSAGSAVRPPDVAIVRGGAARALTRLNAWMGSKRLGEVSPISAKSFDGQTIEAWLTLPPGYRPGTRVPTILEIHGGPYAAYGPNFATDNQLYAAAGYAVISANPRGSTSYGQAFEDGIQLSYPGRDYDDLMAVVDAAVAQGVADPEHLFVTGGSGGGVLTTWIVGKTNRFKAAAAQKPVIDWASFVLTADAPNVFGPYWMGKYPWEDPQGYWARSPLSLVGNVKTPTLVVVGTEDYRTPVSESEQYYTALKVRGVPTALVKVPGANHGGLTARPSQSAAKAAAILAWFGRYRDGVK